SASLAVSACFMISLLSLSEKPSPFNANMALGQREKHWNVRYLFGILHPMDHPAVELLNGSGARRCLSAAKTRIPGSLKSAKRTQWHILAHSSSPQAKTETVKTNPMEHSGTFHRVFRSKIEP